MHATIVIAYAPAAATAASDSGSVTQSSRCPRFTPIGSAFHCRNYLNLKSESNILILNLRKGEPVGIKLVLRKKSIYDFLIYFLFEVLPSLKKFDVLKMNSKSLHWQIKDLFDLDETTYLYIYLIELRSLDIVIEGDHLKPNFFIACRFPIIKISPIIKKI